MLLVYTLWKPLLTITINQYMEHHQYMSLILYLSGVSMCASEIRTAHEFGGITWRWAGPIASCYMVSMACNGNVPPGYEWICNVAMEYHHWIIITYKSSIVSFVYPPVIKRGFKIHENPAKMEAYTCETQQCKLAQLNTVHFVYNICIHTLYPYKELYIYIYNYVYTYVHIHTILYLYT